MFSGNVLKQENNINLKFQREILCWENDYRNTLTLRPPTKRPNWTQIQVYTLQKFYHFSKNFVSGRKIKFYFWRFFYFWWIFSLILFKGNVTNVYYEIFYIFIERYLSFIYLSKHILQVLLSFDNLNFFFNFICFVVISRTSSLIWSPQKGTLKCLFSLSSLINESFSICSLSILIN